MGEDLPAEASAREEPRDLDDGIERDFFLQVLVKIVDTGLEIGITLSLGGGLVSGDLIDGKKYCRTWVRLNWTPPGRHRQKKGGADTDESPKWTVRLKRNYH